MTSLHLWIWRFLVTTCVVYLSEVDTGLTLNNSLRLKSNCVCPGNNETFAECTIVGPSSSTVWGGTAFDCEGNMITLRHRINDTAAGQCRSIVGKIVKVNHFTGEFTSQLTINYYPELFGKTIECFQNYNNGSDEILVGSLLITKPGPLPSPNTLFLSRTDFASRRIIFNWNQVVTNCSNHDIYYSILASNCGSCPTTTNHTNATCTDVPTDGRTCTFAVQTVACGDMENLSHDMIKSLNVTLSFPSESSTISRDVGIALLILIMVAFIVGLVVVWLFWKRFKSKSLDQICISNQDEAMHSSSMPNATIKIFDNETMGTYGLDDNIYEDPLKVTDKMDHPPNLRSLLRTLQGQVTSKWYPFGLALGVPKAILDQLTNYSSEDSLVEVLDYWLSHHPQQPTWKEITDAQNQININA